MERISSDGLSYYRFNFWPDLVHGIFTREGGVSKAPWWSLNTGSSVGDDSAAVRHNHELIYAALGVNGRRACTVWQVHGADIVVVDGPARGRRWLSQADGMITDRVDTPLVMRYADCVPLLFCDAVQGVIGIAHAGWRGTALGVGANTVRAMMQTYGCKPENIQAGIGPGIGPDRYQVGEEVVAAVHAQFGTTEGLIRHDSDDGSAYLDLWAANKLELERAGLQHIEVAGICTAERTDEFYSHRAEQGRTGRFGVVISL